MAVNSTKSWDINVKKYRKRYGSKDYRGIIPNRVDIDERPKIVNEKARIGDVEMDSVIGNGHKGVLVTIAERKSRLFLALPYPWKANHKSKLRMVL